MAIPVYRTVFNNSITMMNRMLQQTQEGLETLVNKLSEIGGFPMVTTYGYNRTNMEYDLIHNAKIGVKMLPSYNVDNVGNSPNGVKYTEGFVLDPNKMLMDGLTLYNPENPGEVITVNAESHVHASDVGKPLNSTKKWYTRGHFTLSSDYYGYERCLFKIPVKDLCMRGYQQVVEHYPYPEEIIMTRKDNPKNFIHFTSIQYKDGHANTFNGHKYNLMIVFDRYRFGNYDPTIPDTKTGNPFKKYTSVWTNDILKEPAIVMDYEETHYVGRPDVVENYLLLPVPDMHYGEELCDSEWDCRVIWTKKSPFDDNMLTLGMQLMKYNVPNAVQNTRVTDFDILDGRYVYYQQNNVYIEDLPRSRTSNPTVTSFGKFATNTATVVNSTGQAVRPGNLGEQVPIFYGPRYTLNDCTQPGRDGHTDTIDYIIPIYEANNQELKTFVTGLVNRRDFRYNISTSSSNSYMHNKVESTYSSWYGLHNATKQMNCVEGTQNNWLPVNIFTKKVYTTGEGAAQVKVSGDIVAFDINGGRHKATLFSNATTMKFNFPASPDTSLVDTTKLEKIMRIGPNLAIAAVAETTPSSMGYETRICNIFDDPLQSGLFISGNLIMLLNRYAICVIDNAGSPVTLYANAYPVTINGIIQLERPKHMNISTVTDLSGTTFTAHDLLQQHENAALIHYDVAYDWNDRRHSAIFAAETSVTLNQAFDTPVQTTTS